MALIGHVDAISRSFVEGWVVDTEHPDDVVSMSIIVDGAHRGMCVTTHTRDDLILPDGRRNTGKSAFHFAFDPPLSPFVEARVEVVETWTSEPIPNGSRTLPRPTPLAGDEAAMVPILVTSTGRTGTTLLMSEFARHPDIVVGDHFPYEIKQIAYHAAAFRTLAADGDRERSTMPETMLAEENRWIIGSNPYNMAGFFNLGGARDVLREYFQSTMPSGLATLFRRFIIEFYATLAKARGRPRAPFFSEKGDIDSAAVEGARLFFDTVRDIVIVRDPRDLLCSAIAFWKMRPEAAMSMLTTTVSRLARIARDAGPDTIVIRYEDLVREPTDTRRALSEFLDLELTVHRFGTETIPDSHRTSRDPAASIGRWREELNQAQSEACDVAFGPFMRDFDYAPSRPTGGRVRSLNGRHGNGGQILAAEGPLAVAAFVDSPTLPGKERSTSRKMLELSFGRDSAGTTFTLDGWSPPERGFVWSNAAKSLIRLPAIRREGDYWLQITASPFTHVTKLPSQRMTLRLNRQPPVTVRARDICVLAIPVPADLPGSDEPIALALGFPDAAQPSAVLGIDDDRQLGFSLHSIALFRDEDEAAAADRTAHRAVARYHRIGVADDVTGTANREADKDGLIARLTATLRRVFDDPELRYRRSRAIRSVAGFGAARFVRLILALEAEFGVHLVEDDVDAIVTMEDLVRLLRGGGRAEAERR